MKRAKFYILIRTPKGSAKQVVYGYISKNILIGYHYDQSHKFWVMTYLPNGMLMKQSISLDDLKVQEDMYITKLDSVLEEINEYRKIYENASVLNEIYHPTKIPSNMKNVLDLTDPKEFAKLYE